jgi:LacI family transcriptional regulator
MAAHDLEVEPDRVQFATAFTQEAGYAAARGLPKGVTAIIAGNDLIALGCYAALEEQGLSCPADVSVVGFNDMPFTSTQRPSLSTVRIPHYEMGCEAARLLLERIATPSAPAKRVVLPVELIVRGSVGRP